MHCCTYFELEMFADLGGGLLHPKFTIDPQERAG